MPTADISRLATTPVPKMTATPDERAKPMAPLSSDSLLQSSLAGQSSNSRSSARTHSARRGRQTKDKVGIKHSEAARIS